jgi:hypothetical protein
VILEVEAGLVALTHYHLVHHSHGAWRAAKGDSA